MGGLVSSIFGGSSKKSQSTSQSGNYNNSLITNALSPALGYVTSGGNALSALLGLGGNTEAQNAAFQNYKNSTGYQAALQGGTDAITNAQFAKGLGNSGATLKALTKYGTGLADQYSQNYISNLLGLAGVGTGAGQLIGSAGQYSTGQSTDRGSSSSGGLGKALGFGLSLLSDRRLKENIRPTGDELRGLPLYSYNYIWDKQKTHIGVMADEAKVLFPEAVYQSGGFDRVNYEVIENA